MKGQREAEGARALADSPHLGELRTLWLSSNTAAPPPGAVALVGSSRLAKLAMLDLSHNRVGDQGVCLIARQPGQARLEKLSLAGNEVHIEAALELAGSPYLPEQISLVLYSNPIFGLDRLRQKLGKRCCSVEQALSLVLSLQEGTLV
jgi:hypothetical protein